MSQQKSCNWKSLSLEIVRQSGCPQERGQFWSARRAAWMEKTRRCADSIVFARSPQKEESVYEKYRPVSRTANKPATVKTMFDSASKRIREREWEEGGKKRRDETRSGWNASPLKRDANVRRGREPVRDKWRGEGPSRTLQHTYDAPLRACAVPRAVSISNRPRALAKATK